MFLPPQPVQSFLQRPEPDQNPADPIRPMHPQAFMIQNSPQTVFIGDIPRKTTLVELYEQMKKLSQT